MIKGKPVAQCECGALKMHDDSDPKRPKTTWHQVIGTFPKLPKEQCWTCKSKR